MNRTTRTQQLAAWLCGVGLILCVVGYRGVTYFPKTEEEEQIDHSIREQIGSQAEPIIDKIDELRLMVQSERKKPYETPGRIALGVGLILAVLGLVMWFQSTPS